MEFHGIKLMDKVQGLQNFTFERLSADPAQNDLWEGRAWQNTTTKKLFWYNGVAVVEIGASDVTQEEVDAIEAGAGLNADGTFTAPNGTTYLASASSLMDMGLKLDAALKAVADTANASTTPEYVDGKVAPVQSELDAVETAVGLNADGTYAAPANTNYLGTSTSVSDALVKLDTEAKTIADVAASKTNAAYVDDQVATALQAAQTYADSKVNGLRWKDPVKDIVADHTAVIGAVSGDRYIDSGDGNIYTKTAAGWTQYVPAENDTVINSAVDLSYTYDGQTSKWVQSSAGDQTTAGVGLVLNGKEVALKPAAGIVASANGTALSVKDNSGLFLTVDGATASTDVAAQLALKLDGTTLAAGANGVKVADAGIDAAQLAAGVVGNGLQGAAGQALAVKLVADSSYLTVDATGLGLDLTALETTLDGVYIKPAAVADAIAASAYTYTAQTSATVHTISHNLNKRFNRVTVYGVDGKVLQPADIEAVDANTVKVTLATSLVITAVIG